jgi:hypothetical protein
MSDNREKLKWYAPESRAAIITIQEFLVMARDGLDPEQIFYYARQSDIKALFGSHANYGEYPGEFDEIMDGEDYFWGKVERSEVIFVGEKILKANGFAVPLKPFRPGRVRDRSRNRPGARQPAM